MTPEDSAKLPDEIVQATAATNDALNKALTLAQTTKELLIVWEKEDLHLFLKRDLLSYRFKQLVNKLNKLPNG
jgi:hypothetical protein